MTKSDAFFYRLAMPRPFASGEGAELTPILAPSGATGNKVNYADGFPSVYSAPSSNGGKFVTRGQMNAIGNLASQNQFYFLAGGINTFDTTFCASIGGYPEGAVLKYLNNGYLYDVISLVDNNTVDFTAQGVDGVNWSYLSVEEKKVFDDVFFKGGNGVSVGTGLLGVVKAKKSSGIVVESSLSVVVGSEVSTYSTAAFGVMTGFGLMIKDLETDPSGAITFPSFTQSGGTFTPNWNGWKSLIGDFAMVKKDTNGYNEYRQDLQGAFAGVEKDNYYAIAIMCGEGIYVWKNANTVLDVTKYTSVSGSLNLNYAS